MAEPRNYRRFLSMDEHLPFLAGDGWRSALRRAVESLMRVPECRRMGGLLYDKVEAGQSAFEAFRDVWDLEIDGEGVIEAIPKEGPVVVVANHPFGGADALGLSTLSIRARPDIRIFSNVEMMRMPGMKDWLLPLEILGEDGAARRNALTMKFALNHLKAGNSLLAFPSGAVAHWHWKTARVEDPPWSPHIARLVNKSGAKVVPVRVFGRNDAIFELLGALHPLLRSALIPHEFLKRRGTLMRCRAGEIVDSSDLPADSVMAIAALREAVSKVSSGTGN